MAGKLNLGKTFYQQNQSSSPKGHSEIQAQGLRPTQFAPALTRVYRPRVTRYTPKGRAVAQNDTDLKTRLKNEK